MPQIAASRVEDHLSFTLERNIVYYKTGKLFGGPWTRLKAKVDGNCYFNAAGAPLKFADMDFQAWKKLGYDQHSIIADPLFVDAENHDYRLQPDSPAPKLGFQPFDYSKAGVYGDPQWIQKAANAQMPPLNLDPGPPPVTIRDDFERAPVGGKPRMATTHTEGRGDTIAVTDIDAAEGRHCLKIEDTAGLQHAFNPHFYYSPNHTSGRTVCRFDLLVEPRVKLNLEWRDWRNSPYRVGPRLNVERNQLIANGKKVLDLPTEEWIGLEIAADLGENNSGKWTLVVTMPGRSPLQVNDLSHATAGFEQLTWLGFTSNATSASTYCVDNLFIKNE